LKLSAANPNQSWLDEFVACFDVATRKNLKIEQAYKIKAANMPSSVFRFRQISEYSLDNLRNDTAWLCSPDKYNDPFDCGATVSARDIIFHPGVGVAEQFIPRLKGLMPEAELIAALQSANPFEEVVRRVVANDPNGKNIDPEPIIEGLKNAVGRSFGPSFQAGLDTLRTDLRMCSFSTRNDIILMWSHYASNHTGFCIEYDVKSLPEIAQRFLFPVIYSKTMFDTTKYFREWAATGLESLNTLFLILQSITKAEEWSYEQEWRLVFNQGLMKSDQNYTLAKPARVYLGARINSDNKRAVADICNDRSIPVTQMRQAAGEFRIIPEV